MSPDLLAATGVTLRLAAVSTLCALIPGVPLAWWISRRQSLFRDIIGNLTVLPLLLPPTVLGFYMLLFLGPDGPGEFFARFADMTTLAFTFTGLVIGSVISVLPYIVLSARSAFEALGRDLTDAAVTLGATRLQIFLRVALPQALPGILAGAVLAFAHIIGEFGLIVMIGGDIPGKTRVLSLLLFNAAETDNMYEAHLIAAGMTTIGFSSLLLLTLLRHKLHPDAPKESR